MRTSESASPLAAPAVGASLLAFIVVYFFVFGAGVFYLLRLMKAGPKVGEEGMTETDGPIRTSGTTPAQQSTAQDDPKRREEEG
jgi:cytochrome d ubiquinol oxidase subunit I